MSVPDHPMPEPARSPAERRLAVRSRTHLPVFLITPGGGTYSAFVTNASSLGFRIRSEYGVAIGRFLSLDVPGLARYSGWVAWSHESQFGLAVANPVPQKVIDHILAIAEEI
jgi:hypothetical protein